MKRFATAIACLLVLSAVAVAASIDGHWSGFAEINGDRTPIELEFVAGTDGVTGKWSLPELGYVRIPFHTLEFDADTGAVAGDKKFATGQLVGNAISGTLMWRRVNAKFQLQKTISAPSHYVEEQIFFMNGDVKLAGTLIIPRKSKRSPAIVFLHGSGPAERWGAMFYAARFAELGFASLIFDKRGCGTSGGDWTASSLDDLAKDALAALNFLKSRKDVDARKIGVWGISQAGWVISRLSSMTNDLAFAIVVSGGGATPYESEMYSYGNTMEHIGIGESDRTEVLALLDRYFDYLKTGEHRSKLLAAIETAKQKQWYRYFSIDRILPSARNRTNWSWVAQYDPSADITKIKFPVLLIFGEKDKEQPVALAKQAWNESLRAAENKDFTIRVFTGANHGIRIGSHHGDENQWPRFVEGYMETQIQWLRARLQ